MKKKNNKKKSRIKKERINESIYGNKEIKNRIKRKWN